MTIRQHAHQLIDRLPESQLTALVGLLETIVDPVTAALPKAPFDDEKETGEERAAVAQARHSLQRSGNGIPHAEASRRRRSSARSKTWLPAAASPSTRSASRLRLLKEDPLPAQRTG